jgi:2-amino-4-hydroxy-6-hydroxymethyldihydropteridine diphosphokinase
MDQVNNVILSLGSNLGNRQAILEEAKLLIKQELGEIYRSSSYWENEPWGFESEHWFLNACVWVQTIQNPHDTLKTCQSIEKKLCKTGSSQKDLNSTRYFSRNIDLDIIFYNKIVLKENKLEIPHSSFQDRKFVLLPLEEIFENNTFNIDKKTLNTILQNTKDRSIIRPLE